MANLIDIYIGHLSRPIIEHLKESGSPLIIGVQRRQETLRPFRLHRRRIPLSQHLKHPVSLRSTCHQLSKLIAPSKTNSSTVTAIIAVPDEFPL